MEERRFAGRVPGRAGHPKPFRRAAAVKDRPSIIARQISISELGIGCLLPFPSNETK
jgi:hypothetical protein